MSSVVYTPAEVLHWFDTDTKRTQSVARQKSIVAAKKTNEEGIIPGIKEAASAAYNFGKGAIGTIVQKSAEETRYELHESGLESINLTRRLKVDYTEIRQIIANSNDRFQILFNGGSLTIKPVAHLVAGRHRAPVGWVRNGVEVPYAMLIEEISARSGIEIEAE